MSTTASWFFEELRTTPLSICVGLQLIFFAIIHRILPSCMFGYRRLLTPETRIEIALLLNTNLSIIITGIVAWCLWPGSFWHRLANPFEVIKSSNTYLYGIDWCLSNTVFDCFIYGVGIRRFDWVYVLHHVAFIACYVDSYFHPCFVLSMWTFYTLETSTLFMNLVWICRNLKVTDQWYYPVIQIWFAFTFIGFRLVCTTIYYIYLGFVVYKNQIRLETTWIIFYGTLYVLNLQWGYFVILKVARKLGWIKQKSKKPNLRKVFNDSNTLKNE